jgi:hypothetical protein
MQGQEIVDCARSESVQGGLAPAARCVVEVCAADGDSREGGDQEEVRRAEHPTRREDRPPSLREAERALARDLGVGEGAVRGLLE